MPRARPRPLLQFGRAVPINPNTYGSRKKMNSRLDRILYAIEHPLGPSRELGSYANHQKSVENLIRDMEARKDSCASPLPVPISESILRAR